MKPEELRIGNLFEYESGMYSTQRISDNFIYAKNTNGFAPGDFPIGKISPIKLTENWLLDKTEFGVLFIAKISKESIYDLTENNEIKIHFRKDKIFLSYYGRELEIKFVHKLQNLYYALIGEELKIKP